MGGYYVPEWKYPHPVKIESHAFMIVGGEEEDADFVLDIFMQKLGPAKKYIKTTLLMQRLLSIWKIAGER